MEQGTKLTLTIGDESFSYEHTSQELNSDVLVQAFATLMISHTYDINSIISSFNKYILENTINYDESKNKN